MTTQCRWHVGEGREQKAHVKDKWQTMGTNQFNKPHQVSEIKRMENHTGPHKANGILQKAEGRGQVPKTDGKSRARTNSTSHTRCLRQKEGKTQHMTTQGTWHVTDGKEQRASVKDRWQTEGTNKLNKLHQMSKTIRK